jgi:carbamoylphosphate synthase large subunit
MKKYNIDTKEGYKEFLNNINSEKKAVVFTKNIFFNVDIIDNEKFKISKNTLKNGTVEVISDNFEESIQKIMKKL